MTQRRSTHYVNETGEREDGTTEDLSAGVRAPTKNSAIVMAVLFLVFFLGLSDNQMISPLLPLIASEFGLEPGDIGTLIGSWYAIAAACSALLVGPVSDRMGRRRFLLWASLVFALSLLVVVFVRHPVLLAGARFFTGLAAGVFSTCSIAYVGDYFPYERRGKAMSVVQSGYFAALIAGVSLGSVLAQWKGWRASFIAFGLVSIAAFWLLLTLPDDTPERVPRDESTSFSRSMKTALRTRERLAAIGAAFFSSAGFMGFILYIGSWLTSGFGLKTSQVGLFFIVVGAAALVGGLAAGPLADRTGKRILSLLSTFALAAALVTIPRLEWGITLFAAFLAASLAFAARQGPLQALATELVPREARGALVALRNTASQIGIAFAAVVAGSLYDSNGFTAVGLFSGITTLGAAFCILLIPEPSHTGENQVDKKQKPVKRRRWIKRVLLSLVILIVIFVFGVAPYLFAMLLTSRGTRPGDRRLTSTPSDYGVEFRDVEYETADGITIKGWLLPARSRNVTIVYAHGLFRSRRELLERAATLWQRGYGGLLYDQRNHGDSEKSATSMGYFERLDALASMRFLRETLKPGERIVLMGLSMGATACLHAAAETSDVSAVVSDSAFFSFDETISHHVRLFFKLPPFPIANEIGFFIEMRAGFDGSRLNSMEAVRKIDGPILFIAGANDRRIPPDVARRLYEASSNPKSDIFIVDGPGTEIHGHAYPAAPERYLERVMKFIDTMD